MNQWEVYVNELLKNKPTYLDKKKRKSIQILNQRYSIESIGQKDIQELFKC